MTSRSSIHTTVMRRVRRVHALRALSSAPIVSAFVFALALWGIGREVWVARVFENMPSLVHADAVGRFMLAAFMNTEGIVQVLSVLAAIAFVWLARNSLRAFSIPRFA
ncbi:MAG TPA: hypothetical protein VFY28_02735 [Candidatus Paceibacterota bacterium]|nr:hypothetical protein [Candidatus Paceibacterota bacterium]